MVYDAVGKTTWEGSLDCLQPRGLMVSFGNASGPVAPVNLGILSQKGSLYVTRPTLATHIATRADLVERSNDLFNVVKSKQGEDRDHGAATSSRTPRRRTAIWKGRKTTGSVVLIP